MKKEYMKWFAEAKYGLFIHWGLYAMLGGEWKGERIPYGTEWIMRNAKIPLAEYQELAKQFNPVDFNADEVAKLAKECGMKYVVFTAKHHDGFAMYDSKVSDYTIMNTPYGRDIVKELAVACKKAGLIFCIYYSQMQDWEDENADGNTWDFIDKEKDFKQYFENKVKPQVKELLLQYGELGLIWFDTPYDMPKELCKELEAWVKHWQPNCIVNGRIGYGYGDYRQMGDNGIPVQGFRGAWETPMTLNDTWGYSKVDQNWKSPQTVMKMLIDIVGKGGNFLLNIGPDARGNIPAGSQEILKRIGTWIKENSESIYGTEAAPDFPYQLKWGGFTYRREQKKLYMHVIEQPEFPYEICVVGLETRVKNISLLRTGEKLQFFQSYEKARDEYRLRVIFPQEVLVDLNTVAVIELEEKPQIQSLYSLLG